MQQLQRKQNCLKKDSRKGIKRLFTDVVAEELKKGEKIQLVGFGTFEVSERAAREGRNPRSGEVMHIAASKAPKFKAGKALKRYCKRIECSFDITLTAGFYGSGSFSISISAI